MLITLNELGKFLYKSINEFMASLTKKCKGIGQFCGCLPPTEKDQRKRKEKEKLLKNEAKGGEGEDPAKAVVSFNL
jgi:hypothetical protein